MAKENPMNPPCAACLSKPASIDGHADLSVRTVGSTMLTFECRRCHSLWARTAERGVFSWVPLDQRAGRTVAMGPIVPPRSDPFLDPDPAGTA